MSQRNDLYEANVIIHNLQNELELAKTALKEHNCASSKFPRILQMADHELTESRYKLRERLEFIRQIIVEG